MVPGVYIAWLCRGDWLISFYPLPIRNTAVSLIAELKRRNVFKVSAAYLALSWAVIEISGTLVPALHLPEWTLSLLVWVALIGFPFVALFAWVFELTPDGLKRSNDVDRSESISTRTSRRLDYIIIAMLGVVTVMFALDRFYQREGETEVVAERVAPQAAEPSTPAVANEPAATQHAESLPAPIEKSIAVLPFVDMSQAKDQEYFADGMSEELLNLLAKAPDLKVIARTSSFAFKGKEVPIADIAKMLGVAHVLEGSVRKSGNMVRITAQLIRAADSTHLWSETYDRPLDDIFKVQDEIAGAIADSLQIQFKGGSLDLRRGGTHNLDAYQLVLKAKSALLKTTRLSLDAAQSYLENAIQLDPTYGQAWGFLADAFMNKADSGYINVNEGYERSREAAQRAVEVSPENAYAHAKLEYFYLNHAWDWKSAETEQQRAFEIDPNDPEVINVAGIHSYIRCRFENAEQQFRRLLEVDPLAPYALWNLGYALYGAGRLADADLIFRKLIEIEPEFSWTANSLAAVLVVQGNADEALEVVKRQADDDERYKLLPLFLYATGQETASDEAMREQEIRWATRGAYFIAITHVFRGEHDGAIAWLERAYEQKDPWLGSICGERLFAGIADDPRYKAFLRKMNLPEKPPG